MSSPRLQAVSDTVRMPVHQPSSLSAFRFISGSNDNGRKYWNVFPVKNKASDEVWVQKRQPTSGAGVSLSTVTGAVNCNAVYNLAMSSLTDVYVAALWDSTNSKFLIVQYRPTAGTCLKIGELTGAASTDSVYLSEINSGGVATLGVVYHTASYTNSKAYYAISSGGVFTAASLTQILDADFPTNLGTPDHLTGPMLWLNGTTYVLTRSGSLYNSDINDVTSWNGLGIIKAIQYPDRGVAMARYKHHIVVFGEDSIEFFNDEQQPAPGTPLKRTDQAFIKFGCLSPRSFCNVDDVLYWIAKSSSGTNGIWKLDGYTPVKISSQDEDTIISSTAESFTSHQHAARMWPVVFNGKKHIMIGLITSNGCGLGIVGGADLTSDVNGLTASDFRGGQLCMTIEGEDFWFYQAGFSTTGQKFFPLMAGNFQSDGVKSGTMYFPGAYVSTTTTTIGKSIFMLSGTLSNGATSGFDFDDYANTTGVMLPCGFQLPEIDFGSDKLKRINRIAVVQHGIQSGVTASNLWFVLSRNSIQSLSASENYNSVVVRSITLPNTYNMLRTLNWGVVRNAAIGILYKGEVQVSFKELEMDVIQGTH